MSTLRRLTDLGTDAGVGWPQVEQSLRRPAVVLVCRGSAAGTWAATGAAEQWRRRTAELRVDLLGLVVVAASARKPPRIVVERVQLLTGWLPQVWRVDWVETLLAADDPRDVGTPPDVAALRQTLVKNRK